MRLSNFLIILLSLLILVPACSGEKENEDTGQKGREIEYTREITFLDTEGNPVTTIDVAVADDANERNMGLMDVNNLPMDKGMLFIFEQQQPLSFWMANTPLSLDIFFVN